MNNKRLSQNQRLYAEGYVEGIKKYSQDAQKISVKQCYKELNRMSDGKKINDKKTNEERGEAEHLLAGYYNAAIAELRRGAKR